MLTLSSDPSSQSGSPSQCHRLGTHWLFSHTKSVGEQVFGTAGGGGKRRNGEFSEGEQHENNMSTKEERAEATLEVRLGS